jgi:hypothetical protein
MTPTTPDITLLSGLTTPVKVMFFWHYATVFAPGPLRVGHQPHDGEAAQ